MKRIRNVLLIISVLSICFTLFACGNDPCKEHIDENNDGKCDKCKEEITTEAAKILLFENGIPTFQFVTEKSLNKDIRKILDEYADAMEEIDSPIDIVEASEDNEIECEILIGDVENRDAKYSYDKYSLGKDGYIFKIIDSKIIINAGSTDKLESAIEEFLEDVLMFDEDTEDYGTLYMTSEQEVIEIQEYDITALKINGNDMRGYTIAVSTTDKNQSGAAKMLQEAIYNASGYWLEIVSSDKEDKSIIMKKIERVYDDRSFKISANDNDQLVIEYAFSNKLSTALSSFATQKIILADGEINFTGTVYSQDISFLTYEEFGAKGDGKTNDFEALYKTHIEANEYKQTVKANDNATYYIKESFVVENGTNYVKEIPVKTNVIWGKAKFIIDDTSISSMDHGTTIYSMSQSDIFDIQSDYIESKIKDEAKLDAIIADGLKPGTTKINLSFNGPVMLIPYDSSHTVYRRKGYGSAQGAKMHEVIVIDKDGNVDPSTPIMFTYLHLDEIEVHRLDIEPITIDGGIFTTMASRVNCLYTNEEGKLDCKSAYISRGIDCRRSFTTIKNVEHYVINEITLDEQIDNGETVLVPAPYMGFYSSTKANEVTYENCILTGRRCYKRPDNCLSSGTSGTYDLYGDEVNKLVFKNCTQSNFWITVDQATAKISASSRGAANAVTSMSSYTWEGKTVKMHWGVGGTNFCKNMEYIGSTLSRFDAHAGLYNGKIIDSTVNYMALTGNGDFIVENVEWFSEGTGANSASIFHLRADYGSTWEGNITVKDLKAYIHTDGAAYLFMHSYNNWYYGYTSYMPNLSIDNLDVYSIETFDPVPAGREIMMLQASLRDEPGIHLSYTKKTAGIYCYIDLDKDGFVDGTDVEYDAEKKAKYENGIKLDESSENYYKNNNPIKPPKYLKILNNDGVGGMGGYKFVVYDTYGTAKAADDIENLPDGVDADGGFFAATKFYYSETDYFLGTNHSGNDTFVFKKY